MDLLGSILNSMDKPPTKTDEEKEQIKKQKLELEKRETEEKEALKSFKKMVTDRVDKFNKDDTRTRLEFNPLEQRFRNIIRDASDDAGFIYHSFEDPSFEYSEEKRVILFKKEDPPGEDELAVLKNGQQWNQDTALELAKKRKADQMEQEDKERPSEPENFAPSHNYQEKYQRLINFDGTLPKDSAVKTETNQSYGNVPSSLKKDSRTIEQVLKSIHEKRMKLELEEKAKLAAKGSSSSTATSTATSTTNNNDQPIP